MLNKLLLSVAMLVTTVSFNDLKDESFTPQKPVKYVSENGKMSANMPGEYEVTMDDSESTTIAKISTSVDDVNFMFSWTLHKNPLEDHEGLARVSLDSFQETIGAEILKEELYKYGKNKGLNAILKLEDVAFIRYKVILIDQYQFQLVVVGPEDNFEKMAKKFFKSFKYKD